MGFAFISVIEPVVGVRFPANRPPGSRDDIDRGPFPGISVVQIMNLHSSAVVISSFGVSAVVAVSSLDAPRGT
jgi:hypothetical protein